MDKYLVIYVYDNGTAEYQFNDDDKKAVASALSFIKEDWITHAFVLDLHTQKETWDSAETKCSHPAARVAWKCVAWETREQPAEYSGWATCKICGEEMDVEDLPSFAALED